MAQRLFKCENLIYTNEDTPIIIVQLLGSTIIDGRKVTVHCCAETVVQAKRVKFLYANKDTPIIVQL